MPLPVRKILARPETRSAGMSAGIRPAGFSFFPASLLLSAPVRLQPQERFLARVERGGTSAGCGNLRQ